MKLDKQEIYDVPARSYPCGIGQFDLIITLILSNLCGDQQGGSSVETKLLAETDEIQLGDAFINNVITFPSFDFFGWKIIGLCSRTWI